MSAATQTFGLPTRYNVGHGGSVAAIGARLWLRLVKNTKARLALMAEQRAERELLALAQQYETSMPSFAAELRAANGRRS